ncbi:glycine zipper 2TM domain-containing protein [Ramlibacter alkalitolerans]|uniref:Glycine zipper 2TM domain-containing protein n=1 Tax=Ramlibacter alkalitolerans TaxID=2039631 RepID=A0ABS1JRA2_9BURK|nr:glycine zipper 2TM domain-containing protein [Ramlibacter alkalitolerans]MBL0426804.1 glycine zipper 2TM domain-containing protein [Ramlibacter alkalitolerans]
MKRTALAPALLLATLAAATAQAQSFTDQARVRAVEPQYEVVQTPRQECTSQWVQEQPRAAAPSGGYGGAIIGGVAGGLLGNQVGKGHGREAATAAGAVIGALTGDRLANSGTAVAAPAPEAREVRNCRTVYDQQNRLTGYRVIYDYRGQEASTVMREQPGSTIPVRVSVTPLEPEFRR